MAFTANVDRSMILPPLVINQYLKARAFSRRHILNRQNLDIMWAANKKAWMTTQVFKQFMLDFEKKMVAT